MLVTGRIKLDWANVDAGELFGWYNSVTATDAEASSRGHTIPNKFLGVKIDASVAYNTHALVSLAQLIRRACLVSGQIHPLGALKGMTRQINDPFNPLARDRLQVEELAAGR